jgi:hypothetical protein
LLAIAAGAHTVMAAVGKPAGPPMAPSGKVHMASIKTISEMTTSFNSDEISFASGITEEIYSNSD